MCGIVGYLGEKPASTVVLSGLEALEYRGYDSAGIALINDNKAKLIKQAGRVDALITSVHAARPKGHLGIGHTRWATHGAPTTRNAHPHTNSDETIFVVHNGIIENYLELRELLAKKGYAFVTDTDTEVVPHLIDYYFKQLHSFEKAFIAALRDLRGAYAIAAVSIHAPDSLFAARLSSPLVIGVGTNEYILASDPNALMEHTKEVVFLEDYDVAIMQGGKLKVHNLLREKTVKPKTELLDYDSEQASLGSFPHFMLKEIFEAPQTIRAATLGRGLVDQNIVKLGGLENVAAQLKYIDRIVIVACGTSSYASLVGEYLIEELAGIPVEVQLGSEFKYRQEPFSRSTALIVVSQSGETADTIAALQKVQDYGVLKLGVINAVGSTMARMTDAGVYCHAGPEQAVASTKAFLAQVTVLTLIALYLSNGSTKLYKPLLKELDALPNKAQLILDQVEQIKAITLKYKDYKDFLFIGRGYAYPVALEGSLKLKECALVHAEGYAAGEMKHGPLALIDENFPTLVLATDSSLLEKTYSNIQEIRARKGPVIAVATVGNTDIENFADDVIYIPKTMEQTAPLLQVIVMQLMSYYIAVSHGYDVDRPRNLAKSVTVE